MSFFTENDFFEFELANEKLMNEGIMGYSQLHRGAWTFTERKMSGDSHRAVLLNLEALNPCAHEKEKVHGIKSFGTEGNFMCECGASVEITGFAEKKK